jgi:predicted dienelactone hydrolase
MRFLAGLLCVCMIAVAAAASTGASQESVGRRSFHFYDGQRRMHLPVEVWYPVERGTPGVPPESLWRQAPAAWYGAPEGRRLPLILLSHGFCGEPETMSWFAEALARNGFVVAAPAHRDSIPSEPNLHRWDRPLDVSFALTSLLATQFGQDTIDAAAVGMAGFSLGGTTAIWLSGGRATQFRKTVHPCIGTFSKIRISRKLHNPTKTSGFGHFL